MRFPPECVRRWYLERYPSEIAPGPVEGDTPRLQAASHLYNLVFNNLWQDAHVGDEGAHPLDEIAPDHAPFVQTEFTPQSFRSEEHTSELQSLMRISYAVFCLKKK